MGEPELSGSWARTRSSDPRGRGSAERMPRGPARRAGPLGIRSALPRPRGSEDRVRAQLPESSGSPIAVRRLPADGDTDHAPDEVREDRRGRTQAHLPEAREEEAAAGQQADQCPDDEQGREARDEGGHEDQRAAAEEVRDDRHDGTQAEGGEGSSGCRPWRTDLRRVEAELLADQRLEGGFGILEDRVGDSARVRLRDPLRYVDPDEVILLLLRDRGELRSLQRDLAVEHLA